jgi:hypothetical protein
MKLSFIEKLESKLRKLVGGAQRTPDRISGQRDRVWLRPRQQVGQVRSQAGDCMSSYQATRSHSPQDHTVNFFCYNARLNTAFGRMH